MQKKLASYLFANHGYVATLHLFAIKLYVFLHFSFQFYVVAMLWFG